MTMKPLTEDDVKLLAENELRCECGNADWHDFAYVGWGMVVIAACRQCGRTYDYDKMDAHGKWALSSQNNA